MEQIFEELAEILEIDPSEISGDKKFTDYPSFDSLAALSVIAFADAEYDKSLNRNQLLEFQNIGDFCKYLES